MNKRDEALDAVKGFAILLVMLGHCMVLNGLDDPYLYDAIAAVQMPLFMLASGYSAGLLIPDLSHKPDGTAWRKRLFRRSISYLLPFFSWMILTHLTNPLQELKLQLFALDRGLWFLMTLWIVNLVTMTGTYGSELITWHVGRQKMDEKKRKACRLLLFLLFIGICYLGFVIQSRHGNGFLSPSLTVKYLPFYTAGYLWTQYVLPVFRTEKKQRKGELLIWSLSLVLFLFVIIKFDTISVTDTRSLALQMGTSLLGSFVCFYCIYHFAGGRLKQGLSFLGKYTLEIYVLHFRFARLLGMGKWEPAPYSLEAAGFIIASFLVMSILTAVCIFVIKKIRPLNLLLFGRLH
ncbi:MAG: acyltransferase family protein [Lachnospiraceae bacterium]|nr:acyltransferase family protein [Lachnospiraceae bacterium]